MMQIVKYFILFLILLLSSLIGKLLSTKYVHRLQELEEIQNALSMLKTKIKFAYDPIPDIFNEISERTIKNVANIFKLANENMKYKTADIAWEQAIEKVDTNLNKDDKQILKNLSKLLGKTDAEGQISQIEIVQNFLNTQINQAVEEKQKNEKLFTRLGTIFGLTIIIILY